VVRVAGGLKFIKC